MSTCARLPASHVTFALSVVAVDEQGNASASRAGARTTVVKNHCGGETKMCL